MAVCMRIYVAMPTLAAAGRLPARTAAWPAWPAWSARPASARPPRTLHLPVRLLHSHGHDRLAVVSHDGIWGLQARRHLTWSARQSKAAADPPRQAKPAAPLPRGRLPTLRLLLRAVIMPFRGHSIRGLYRQNPEETVLALAILVAFVFIFAYIGRIYYTYFNSRQFTRYPPAVAKYLRRALYFSNYNPDPKRALKNYKLALEQCDELGLDPFSDDVLGIRIQLATWLERVQNYEAAIKILELLLGDCQRWVEKMEKGVADGSIQDRGDMSARLPSREKQEQAAAAATTTTVAKRREPSSEVETLWGRRSRILRKAIGISVKLGELYADEHVLDTELAHERLVWSVDTALQEFQRRSVQGVKAGEGEWMSPEEMGAALESLGLSYESRSQFHLALPLFFQALRVCKDPCHSAVIMNNLAISFAQHPLQPPYETLAGPVLDTKPGAAPPTPEEARKAYLAAARRWAQNAHDHASGETKESRTAECDTACVVSLCNLGDIALLMGDTAEAQRRFRQARDMGTKIAFPAGVEQAEAGLRRIS